MMSPTSSIEMVSTYRHIETKFAIALVSGFMIGSMVAKWQFCHLALNRGIIPNCEKCKVSLLISRITCMGACVLAVDAPYGLLGSVTAINAGVAVARMLVHHICVSREEIFGAYLEV